MMKKVGIALLCAALGTTLYARDDISTSNLFVGLELESTKVDASTELLLTDDAFNVLDSVKYGDTLDSTIEYVFVWVQRNRIGEQPFFIHITMMIKMVQR